MPHDSNGIELQDGDRVTIQATVRRVFGDSQSNDTCNVELQLDGEATYRPVVTCSAGLATKVNQ